MLEQKHHLLLLLCCQSCYTFSENKIINKIKNQFQVEIWINNRVRKQLLYNTAELFHIISFAIERRINILIILIVLHQLIFLGFLDFTNDFSIKNKYVKSILKVGQLKIPSKIKNNVFE